MSPLQGWSSSRQVSAGGPSKESSPWSLPAWSGNPSHFIQENQLPCCSETCIHLWLCRLRNRNTYLWLSPRGLPASSYGSSPASAPPLPSADSAGPQYVPLGVFLELPIGTGELLASVSLTRDPGQWKEPWSSETLNSHIWRESLVGPPEKRAVQAPWRITSVLRFAPPRPCLPGGGC